MSFIKFLKTKDFKIAVLSSVIPIFFMILWQITNIGLPIADANDFIGAAGRISNYFWSGEIFKGFYELYSDRPWRPVSFHLLLFPFMLISKNNIIFTSACVHSLCLFFIIVYSYFIFRKVCDNKNLCSLSAIIIGLLSNSFFPGGLILFAEAALTPSILAAIYHLSCSNFMQNKKHSIYTLIAIIIAFTVRPVEAITYLLPVFIYFFYRGYKNNIFSFDCIQNVLKILLVPIFILALRGLDIEADRRFQNLNNGEGSDLYLKLFKFFLIFLLILFISKTKNFFVFVKNSALVYKNYSVLIFSIFSLIFFIWFYDSWRDLYIWIYTTQFGKVATSSNFFSFPITFENLIDNIFWQFSWAGLLPVVVIFSIFILSYLYKIYFKSSHYNFESFKYFLISIILPFLIVIITISNTPRKFAATYIIILVMGFLLILSLNKLKKFLYVSLTLLIICQSFSIYTISVNSKPQKFTSFISGNSIPNPKRYSVEPKIIDLIYSKSKEFSFKNVDLTYIYPGIDVDIFQSSLLNSLKPNLTYITSLPLLFDTPYSRKWIIERFSTTDAFFIINPNGSLDLSNDKANIFLEKSKEIKNSQEKFYEELLYFYLSGKLEKEHGFINIGCMEIDTADIELNKENKVIQEGCLLAKKNLKNNNAN